MVHEKILYCGNRKSYCLYKAIVFRVFWTVEVTIFEQKGEQTKQNEYYNTIFVPALIYGSECWVLSAKLESKIAVMEITI